MSCQPHIAPSISNITAEGLFRKISELDGMVDALSKRAEPLPAIVLQTAHDMIQRIASSLLERLKEKPQGHLQPTEALLHPISLMPTSSEPNSLLEPSLSLRPPLLPCSSFSSIGENSIQTVPSDHTHTLSLTFETLGFDPATPKNAVRVAAQVAQPAPTLRTSAKGNPVPTAEFRQMPLVASNTPVLPQKTTPTPPITVTPSRLPSTTSEISMLTPYQPFISGNQSHPAALVNSVLEVTRFFDELKKKAMTGAPLPLNASPITPEVMTALTQHPHVGWAVIKTVWNLTPSDFDRNIMEILLHQKCNRLSEEILLSICAVDLRNVRTLSAFAASIIKEYETASHVCMRFMAGICPHETHGTAPNQCPFVHPQHTPGWNLLQERWKITYRSFDYGVVNYLCKQRVEHREAILSSFSEMNLGNIKNLSAYLSCLINTHLKQRNLA